MPCVLSKSFQDGDCAAYRFSTQAAAPKSGGPKHVRVRGSAMASLKAFGRTVTDVLAIATNARPLDVVELWSGCGHIAQAARKNNLAAATFEILDDIHDDITAEVGLGKAASMFATARTKDCGPEQLPLTNPQLANLASCECRHCPHTIDACHSNTSHTLHTPSPFPPPHYDIHKSSQQRCTLHHARRRSTRS